MRIIIIARNLAKNLSTPHYAMKLAQGLVKRGIEVFVFTSNPRVYLDGVRIVELPKVLARRTLSPMLYSMLAKYADRVHGIDVVHGHGYTLRDDVTTVHFLRKGFRYKVKMLGYDVPQSRDELFEGLILRSARRLIAPSNMVKECLMKIYGIGSECVSVIHHGVDTSEFTVPSPKEKANARKALGLDKGSTYLGFAGPPHWKGLDYILHALAKLPEEACLLAVNVSASDHCIELSKRLGVEGRVKVLPPISGMSLFYRAIDIFVLPTMFDVFSLTTLEAMASGLPVVVSSHAGVSEVIGDDEGFILKDPRDVDRLAETLNVLIENDKLRRTIGLNARKAAEKLSWDNTVARTVEVYESLLRR